MPTGFAAATAVTPLAPGRFGAHVGATWTIAGKPNGGYLLAVLARAAAGTATHPHVIAAGAHYLHSPDPGAVEVTTEVLRFGRSADQVRARLLQAGRCCVEALLTMATLDPADKPYWTVGVPDVAIAPLTDCVRVPAVSPVGLPVPIMDEVGVRIDPATLGYASGRPSGDGELRGWLALPDSEPFDPAALLYAVDALPPATFEIEPTGWVPTLELTAYVRALPEPGPVQVLQRAQLIDGQRVDETCFVWDVAGRLVAQATQLAGIRLG
jgi:hypothetical protein